MNEIDVRCCPPVVDLGNCVLVGIDWSTDGTINNVRVSSQQRTVSVIYVNFVSVARHTHLRMHSVANQTHA